MIEPDNAGPDFRRLRDKILLLKTTESKQSEPELKSLKTTHLCSENPAKNYQFVTPKLERLDPITVLTNEVVPIICKRELHSTYQKIHNCFFYECHTICRTDTSNLLQRSPCASLSRCASNCMHFHEAFPQPR